MFRPNRIGTPVIHDSTANESTADYTLQQRVWTSVVQPYNVINAIPVGDFGRSQLNWSGNKVLDALKQCAQAQQFTVQAPAEGDTVGIELNGYFTVYCAARLTLRPIFFRQEAALSTLLQGGDSGDSPTGIGEGLQGDVAAAQTKYEIRTLRYQTQIIAKSTSSIAVAGPYAHGLAFINPHATETAAITWVNSVCSVRQLNNQQDVGYRDTLR